MGCLRRLSFTVTRTHPTLQMCILFVLIPCTLLPQRCDMARHETQHRHQHAAHSIHYRECTVPSTFSIHCPSINALVRSCGAVSEHRRSASPASLLMSARAKTQQAFGVSEQSRDARPSTATVDVVAIADARHLASEVLTCLQRATIRPTSAANEWSHIAHTLIQPAGCSRAWMLGVLSALAASDATLTSVVGALLHDPAQDCADPPSALSVSHTPHLCAHLRSPHDVVEKAAQRIDAMLMCRGSGVLLHAWVVLGRQFFTVLRDEITHNYARVVAALKKRSDVVVGPSGCVSDGSIHSRSAFNIAVKLVQPHGTNSTNQINGKPIRVRMSFHRAAHAHGVCLAMF